MHVSITKIEAILLFVRNGLIDHEVVNVKLENVRFPQRFDAQLSEYDNFDFDYALIKLDKTILR